MDRTSSFRRIVAKRIRHLARVRDLAAEGFEFIPNPALVVRRMDVVRYVATRLGVVAGNRLCADVRAAVASLGWEAVDTGGYAFFRNVKPRNMSTDEALATSREERRKARYGQAK